MTYFRSGTPWYHVEWRDLPGGNTWEPDKNLEGEDGIALIRCYEEERARAAAEYLRARVMHYSHVVAVFARFVISSFPYLNVILLLRRNQLVHRQRR